MKYVIKLPDGHKYEIVREKKTEEDHSDDIIALVALGLMTAIIIAAFVYLLGR